MSDPSPLTRILRQWARNGGNLMSLLDALTDPAVETGEEAEAICAALDAISVYADAEEGDSSLHALVDLFQDVESKEAFSVLVREGLPRLRAFVRHGPNGEDVDEEDLMFILKVLAMYRQPEDVEVIAEAARKPVDGDGFMWSVVFEHFDDEHPFSGRMVDELRHPLPSGFICIAYLDMANCLAIAGVLDSHPFDTAEGHGRLEAWLRDQDRALTSYAQSAAASLPFLAEEPRERLLRIAERHVGVRVQMEAAWARARCRDSSGLSVLARLCLDPAYSAAAQDYLEELGHRDRIPVACSEPEFEARAELADWLAHPNELGRPPDTIEVYDTRTLYWPPTRDRRQLWLVQYTYGDTDRAEPSRGVGMVGSVTLALWGENTADLAPEDVYGLHCAWELEINQDPMAPDERTAVAGRAILARHNPGF